MQSRETNFERDPHLRRNDSLAPKTTNTSSNKWVEAMKDAPSFSEHMKHVEARSASNQNAFSQASGKMSSTQNQANAFSRNVSSGHSTSRATSNNAIRSATYAQTKNSAGTVQTASAGYSQSASRSK